MAVGHTGVLEIVASVAEKVDRNLVISLLPAEPAQALVLPTVFGSRLLGTLGNGMLALVYLGIGILILVAAVASTGALIHAAKRFKKTKSEPLHKAWHHGVSRFWPLLWLNFGKKVALALLVWVLGIPLAALVAGSTGTLGMIGFVLLFIVALLGGLVISFLVNFASMYVVLENEHLGESIADAWKLFKAHWLVSLEMALLLLAIQIAVFFIGLVGFSLMFLPFLAFWLASFILGIKILVPIGGVIAYGLGVLFIVWLISWYSTFAISAWTILYTHLRSPKARVKSVVHRMLTGPFKK